jgi:CDGSH-type Zn-finger protein
VIICRFATDNTAKLVLLANKSGMEEKNGKKSRALIEVEEFGPLVITGNFTVKDLQRNTEYSPGEIRLCRCGKSENKPYCNDSCKK